MIIVDKMIHILESLTEFSEFKEIKVYQYLTRIHFLFLEKAFRLESFQLPKSQYRDTIQQRSVLMSRKNRTSLKNSSTMFDTFRFSFHLTDVYGDREFCVDPFRLGYRNHLVAISSLLHISFFMCFKNERFFASYFLF